MAKRGSKSVLSLKNPMVRYGLYGAIGYYAYCFLKDGSVTLPIIGTIGSGAPLPEPTVSAFPTRWMP